MTALADAAVELWRLQQWAFAAGFEKDRAVARRTARTLDSVLKEAGLELCDLVGHGYDPGLAVEVIDTEYDPDIHTGCTRIHETIAPIVLRGQVVRTGQVIVCCGPETD